MSVNEKGRTEKVCPMQYISGIKVCPSFIWQYTKSEKWNKKKIVTCHRLHTSFSWYTLQGNKTAHFLVSPREFLSFSLRFVFLWTSISYFTLSYIQLCGFRGGGNSAAKSLFWQARKGQSFVLVFESERERNAAIMLARRYALDCNVGIFCCLSFAVSILCLTPHIRKM